MRFLAKCRKYTIICTILFVFQYIMVLPLQYKIFNINILTKFYEKHLNRLLTFFISNNEDITFTLYSDSSGLYWVLIIILIISFVLTLVFGAVEKLTSFNFSSKTALTILFLILTYFLSYQMAIYGFNKLFKFQFYDAHPNTLFTPVGYLTKDFLFWTSMGASKLYSIVTGACEVMITILLLIRKTRNFAIFLGFFVCLFIVLINFSFDINVKIQSLSLFVFFSILLLPNLKTYYLFFTQKKVTLNLAPKLSSNKNIHSAVKTIVLLAIFIESLYPYMQSNTYDGDYATKPPYYGAYAIINDSKYKRFFIHSDPYFILQDQEDNMYSYPMQMMADNILLENDNSTIKLSYFVEDGVFHISGHILNEPLDIRAIEIDISKMPLLDDSFNWTIDNFINQ